VADVASLHRLWNPVETDAHRGEEKKARGVNWLVSFHVSVLACAPVSLTEGNTWAAVGHTASLDWRTASEESSGVLLGLNWALGVDSLTNVGEGLVETIFPVVDVLVINWARRLCSNMRIVMDWSNCLGRSAHRLGSWSLMSRIGSWSASWWVLSVIHWSGHCKLCKSLEESEEWKGV